MCCDDLHFGYSSNMLSCFSAVIYCPNVPNCFLSLRFVTSYFVVLYVDYHIHLHVKSINVMTSGSKGPMMSSMPGQYDSFGGTKT